MEIPQEEFELLAKLLLTVAQIEQANAKKRLNQTEMTSLLDDIINDKHQRDNKNVLDSVNFIKRIKKFNSTRTNMMIVEDQEVSRLDWCSAYHYLKNYQHWEEVYIKWVSVSLLLTITSGKKKVM